MSADHRVIDEGKGDTSMRWRPLALVLAGMAWANVQQMSA